VRGGVDTRDLSRSGAFGIEVATLCCDAAIPHYMSCCVPVASQQYALHSCALDCSLSVLCFLRNYKRCVFLNLRQPAPAAAAQASRTSNSSSIGSRQPRAVDFAFSTPSCTSSASLPSAAATCVASRHHDA
jgi:hypothetical protein